MKIITCIVILITPRDFKQVISMESFICAYQCFSARNDVCIKVVIIRIILTINKIRQYP